MRNTLFSLSQREITFKEYSNYPPVLRDLSVVADGNVTEGEIEQVILSSVPGDILRKLRLYDIYDLKNGQTGKKSYTYTLEFRADDRTLTGEEVNKLQDKIVENLSRKLKAELRK